MDDDAREADRQRAIADAILGEEPPATGRLRVYRRLVRGNLAAVARRLLPRSAGALDRDADGCFERWFSRFLSGGGSSSPYLRDVPREFAAWAIPRWRSDTDVPAFVADLAQFEVDRFEVETTSVSAPPAALGEVNVARPLVFAPSRKLALYEYAVHAPALEPEKLPTLLLLHRDADNEVVTTEVAANREPLLRQLLVGTPLGEALAMTPAWTSPHDAFLEDVARWLATLGEAGALLGGLR